MGKRLEDLVVTEIVDVLSAFNVKIDVTDELMEAGLALLRGQNINTVADMVKSPDSIVQLMSFMQRGLGIAPDEYDSFEYTSPVLIEHEAAAAIVHEQPTQRRLVTANPGWRLPTY
nr:P12 [Red mite associated cystovirus]